MENLNPFEQIGLAASSLEALRIKGCEQPTEIQELVIPLLLNGERDIIGQAQTGTGKTAAFGLPILEKIEQGGSTPQALILTPTRELAIQVAKELDSLAGRKAVSITAVYGGQSIDQQIRRLRAGVDIDLKRRKFVDVQVIFMKMEPRTLTAAYKFFVDKELSNAHSAEADTMATYEVLQAQLDRYSNLENDIGKLAEFSAHTRNVDFAGRIVYNEDDVEVFNFGKHKGKPVTEVLEKDPGYYGWMMKGDFPLYTKKVLTSIKLGSIKK